MLLDFSLLLYNVMLVLVKNRIKYRHKCVIVLQKVIRGHLARKQHQPRIQGIAKISKIRENAKKTVEIVNQLKSGKESILKDFSSIETQINAAMEAIKRNLKISSKDIDNLYLSLMADVNKMTVALNNKLKDQRQAEEQERLRKVQLELDMQRKAKEEEERKLMEDEENRRL